MAIAIIQPSFASGELSPSVYGRVDLAKWHTGAATMRNMFANYRGGAVSRGGTAFVGQCKQSGGSNPPRLIPFQFNITQGYILEFGDNYMRVMFSGAYVTETPVNISGITNANPGAITTSAPHGYSNGDWVYPSGIGGMTKLNQITAIVANVTSTTFTLVSPITGVAVDTTNYGVYTSGGTVARIYTLSTPYAAVDLPYLKFTQSADVMTLTCVNQTTGTEYPPYDLARVAANSWTLTQITFATAATAPASLTATASTTTTSNATQYQYVVTTVDAKTGQESTASPIATVTNSVNIASTLGSIALNWPAVSAAGAYNIYKAPAAYSNSVPAGSLFGYAGQALGNSFVDNNITAQFATVPPLHRNPFARGAITSLTITNQGSGYTSSPTVTVNTSTGSGAVFVPVVISGQLQAVIVSNGGQNYALADTITISGGGGANAAATIVLGPLTGTYPGCVAYFQQRRFFANTLNNPDTYFASQTGAFKNMDSAIPAIDSDAIIGTPWAQQVNGIQAMVAMPGGLVILTGLGAWQLSGGSQAAAITPANQSAQPQAYNGCSPIVPPITINYDILYVERKGSIVRDLSYNFFVNIYTGTDMTVLSSHLFQNRLILQWAYAEAPYKVVWCIRDDGTMLSFSYLKDQEVASWARHDTNGLYVSVAAISEPPINAVYLVVKRYILGNWVYYSERMDGRQWSTIEQTWCVDCGLSYPMSFPNATLNASASSGTITLTASSGVFNSGMVGNVIRMGGGVATITAYTDTQHVTAVTTASITSTIPNDPNNTPLPANSGTWSLSVPVTVVSGLNHLEGKTVSILADGSVAPQQTVTNGTVTLQVAATSVLVGLPFQAQLQSLYLDTGTPTTQGKRKNIPAVTVRLESSRGVKVGTNQPDAAAQPNQANIPWTNMREVQERSNHISAGTAIPLFTGDERVITDGNWSKGGQVAVQQDFPLPLSVLAFVPEVVVGDDNG